MPSMVHILFVLWATPSLDDDALTNRIVSALQLIDIRVLDHIIVGKGDCYSYAEEGKL